MRFGSAELRGVIGEGSFNHHWEAELYYNGERRIADVPISAPTFDEDADGEVQQTGSVRVVWSDDFASSLTPRYVTDPLAPYGAELHLFSVVEVGGFRERVEYGWFPITDVPDARDEEFEFRGSWITKGSTVDLEVKERLEAIRQEEFDVPTAPESLASAWNEISIIGGYPIQRTVSDAAIPRSVMYEDVKLDAIYDLMGAVLNAVPHMTADGALAARPIEWPAYVDTIRLSQIESVGSYMSSADVKNRVVVRSSSGDSARVLAIREITSGPLRVRNDDGTRSPFGMRTRYLSSQLVTTPAQAGPWAEKTLAAESTPRARVLPIVEVFNPLRERGDVVLIERRAKWLLARVVKVSRSSKSTQEITVEVGAEYEK